MRQRGGEEYVNDTFRREEKQEPETERKTSLAISIIYLISMAGVAALHIVSVVDLYHYNILLIYFSFNTILHI